MNYGFIIDNRKCIGCHACTVACKSEHEVPIGVNRTWVKYIEKGEFPDTRRLFSVMRCNHCADAPCVEICPVTALYTREDGIVDFDDRRCIACKACTQACPYDALYMHPDTGTAAKCNYCTHRVDIGLEPACVVVCPEHAIISGDMDNPETEISKLLARETVSVRKPEKGTEPKLFYIDGDAVSLRPSEADPNTDYMWSSQSSGVGKFAKFAEERKQLNSDKTVPKKLHQIEPREKKSAKRVYDAPGKGVLWGWEVSAYILTKAIGAGAFLVPAVAGYFTEVSKTAVQIGALVSLFFLAVTGVLLIMDLGRPDRFLNVLFRPQWKSWLTRGAYIITGYGGLLTLWLGASYFGFDAVAKMVEPVTVILALLAAVYTAFLFAQAKGRDFWQSPMLGVHMLIHSVMAGAAALLAVSVFFKDVAAIAGVLLSVLAVSIAVHLITLAIELTTTHTTEDSHAVAKMILKGRFAKTFWVGMVLVGNVVPLILSLFMGATAVVPVTAVLVLVGLYAAQHIWVKAPQTISLS
jgi:Fe-S-cluster-containing dehydrogenase component/formate-dependent nitrite reductase membrane component NrfD